jgi:hypothetical protein
MADDDEYQTFNIQMAESFADSDWEALKLVEKAA